MVSTLNGASLLVWSLPTYVAWPGHDNTHSQATLHNAASLIELMNCLYQFAYTIQFIFLRSIVLRSSDAVKNSFIKETNLRTEGIELKC